MSFEQSYAALYRDLPYGGSLISLLRLRRGTRLAEQEAGGRNYVVIESPPEVGNYRDFGWRIALDPHHGMMPTKIDVLIRSMLSYYYRVAIDRFHEAEPGVWAPLEATIAFGPPGKMASTNKLVVDLSRSHWNQPVSEDLFTLAFPVGTRVKDETRNLVYVTGKPDTGKNVDDLLKGARKVIRLPGPHPPEVEASKKGVGYIVLIGANLLLIAMIVAIIYLRRRRASRVGKV